MDVMGLGNYNESADRVSFKLFDGVYGGRNREFTQLTPPCWPSHQSPISLNRNDQNDSTSAMIFMNDCVWCNKYILLNNNVAGVSCAADELSMNFKCYRKYHESRTWFSASNECLSRGGSLAVFADVGLNSDSNQRTTADNELSAWLNTYGADKTYWIGLVRSWWKVTDKGCVCVALFSLTTTLC